MNVKSYEVVELEQLSGTRATVYSVLFEDEELTRFEQFILENSSANIAAVQNIVKRLQLMGEKTGAREQFFRMWEGLPGDGVCALFDTDEHQLRLYCIRFGNVAIILGGGGIKNVRAWQDDAKLSQEMKIMMEVSKDISRKLVSGEVRWSTDGTRLTGELYFES